MGETRNSKLVKRSYRKFMMLDLQNLWAPNKFIKKKNITLPYDLYPPMTPKEWIQLHFTRLSIGLDTSGDIRVRGQCRHFETHKVVLFITVCAPQFAPFPW